MSTGEAPKSAQAQEELLGEAPWTLAEEKVLEQLDVERGRGLSSGEAKRRRRKYGTNELRKIKARPTWQILISQFKSLMVVLLSIAAILSFTFEKWTEGVAIVAVIVINGAIGFITELRAVRSMEALRKLSRAHAKVRRNGKIEKLAASKLVPGDIVLLEGGAVVTADLRLLEVSKLQANESALTGESTAVDKGTGTVSKETEVAERKNMVFKGTSITRGSGEGVAVSTGMATELGAISAMVEEAEEQVTPLERRLDRLSRKLIWVTLVVAAVAGTAGLIAGEKTLLMIETAIALAVAALPEGLPIVATIALARGMFRMARRNALINELAAVETLGATNIICTDKTGTLTENQMTVERIALPTGEFSLTGEGLSTTGKFKRDGKAIDPRKHEPLRGFLETGVLCSNAELQNGGTETNEAFGEPLEVALLVAAAKAGIRREALLRELPEAREVGFDPDTKMMATFHEADGRILDAVKGAPEAVIDVCSRIVTADGEKEFTDDEKERWLERNDEMAGRGLRLLALARRTVESAEAEPYEGLTFQGLAGMLDPPRTEVREAIEACHNAGIEVVMVTGDQPLTARSIGESVGIVQDEQETEVIRGRDLKPADEMNEEEREHVRQVRIFARVAPRQKLDLIDIHQQTGAVVAMTGDGVNDAPALKSADIGVAMGQRGTEVARQAADMVLKDDAFSTIVDAVRQGRIIFNNIRKFLTYLLSCNVSQITAVAVASVARLPLPVRPLQILFLNVVTDVFPALALGVGPGDPRAMDRPPREPDEPVLTRRHWCGIGGYGVLLSLAVLATLLIGLYGMQMEDRRATTCSFMTLAFVQLWHVFNMRDVDAPVLRNEVTRNGWVWGALALCVVLILGALYAPPLASVLELDPPGPAGWLMVLGMSLTPLLTGQLLMLLREAWRNRTNSNS